MKLLSHWARARRRDHPANETALWPAVALVALVVLTYYRVYGVSFIWDDDSHLTSNPCIVGPLGFKEIWSTAAATYYPLVLTTFWLVHKIVALNPAPYHVLNVLWHAANAVLLWRLLLQLRVRGAWLGAALWTLHPIMVQSVAWITEMKNTQSCFFYLLAIWCFVRWDESRAERHARWRLAGAVVFAAMAVTSKSSTVILPAVLGLCLWWRRRVSPRDLVSLAPFAFLTIAASTWTIWEQKFHSGARGVEWTHTLAERGIIAGRDLWFYAGKLAWPHPLIFNYPRWQVDAANVLSYTPVAAAIVLLIVVWFWRNTRLRPVVIATAYLVIALLPVLGFFDIYFFRYSYVSDHFQYLASIGPLALAGAALTSWTDRMPRGRIAIAAALCGALAFLSWQRTWCYRDAETLWRDTLAQNPDAWLGHDCLAGILYRRGEVAEALPHYEKAIALAPFDPETHSNLAAALFRSGEVPEAIMEWQESLRIKPGDTEVLGYLANALLHDGRVGEAISTLQELLKIEPRNVDALNNLGIAVSQKGRVAEAIDLWKQVVALKPHDEGALHNLTWVLATSADDTVRDAAQAVRYGRELLQASGTSNPRFLRTVAAAYAAADQFPEAIELATRGRQAAEAQRNRALVEELDRNLTLYRSDLPLRDVR